MCNKPHCLIKRITVEKKSKMRRFVCVDIIIQTIPEVFLRLEVTLSLVKHTTTKSKDRGYVDTARPTTTVIKISQIRLTVANTN
jgi:hypothetical protein